MKRVLLPASVVVLALTACGAGHHASALPASRVTKTTERVSAPQPSLKAIAAARERAAAREATALLRRFVAPPGAVRTRDPRGFAGAGEPLPAEQVVDRVAFWRAPGSFSSAVSYVRAHPPAGFRYYQSGESTDLGPRWAFVTFYQRNVRFLGVDVTESRGRIVLRVDANVVWFGPHEKVPPGTAEVDISVLSVSRRVTDPTRVAKIVRWIDALPLRPEATMSCGVDSDAAPPVEFVFRSVNGTRLASASAPWGPADVCYPIDFSIGGKQRGALLVDRPNGPSFVHRVEKLLGVTLTG